MSGQTSDSPFRFHVGQVVRHLRYGYRGVVAERDEKCAADDAWYQKNQTQPDRAQPWYHVLVDNAAHMTYVAQSNLEPDDSGAPIEHPLRDMYFKTFLNGRYHRENLN